VTQANVPSTICRKGDYTAGIRSPVSVTNKEKELGGGASACRCSFSTEFCTY